MAAWSMQADRLAGRIPPRHGRFRPRPWSAFTMHTSYQGKCILPSPPSTVGNISRRIWSTGNLGTGSSSLIGMGHRIRRSTKPGPGNAHTITAGRALKCLNGWIINARPYC